MRWSPWKCQDQENSWTSRADVYGTVYIRQWMDCTIYNIFIMDQSPPVQSVATRTRLTWALATQSGICSFSTEVHAQEYMLRETGIVFSWPYALFLPARWSVTRRSCSAKGFIFYLRSEAWRAGRVLQRVLFFFWHKSFSPDPARPLSSVIDLQALRW